MIEIKYIYGGIELLDDIKPLWYKLNEVHANTSEFFSDFFHKWSYDSRKSDLLEKLKSAKLRVDAAVLNDKSDMVGYCVSTIDKDNGEIDSIYIDEQYRSRGIGHKLMKSALSWMDNNGVKSKTVIVTYGNNSVYKFYEQFNFFPAAVEFEQKNEN